MLFHVTYKDMENRLSVIDNDSIAETLENTYNIDLKQFNVYWYDVTFDDWVTVDDYLEILDKTRLCIEPKGNLHLIYVCTLV